MIGVAGTEYIHYIKPTGNYQVSKKINGSQVSFGNYDTLAEAVKWRDYFRDNNWRTLDRLHYSKSQHIQKLANGKYKVVKQKNKRKISYGVFDTIEEAEYQVKLCKTFDWDIRLKPFNCMQYIHKRTREDGSIAYRIVKHTRYGPEYYGTFNNLEDAKYERDLLLLSDWDYERVATIFDEGEDWLTGKKSTSIHYYRQPNGRIDYDHSMKY